MDYSLLLGIHDLERGVEDALEELEDEEEEDDYDSGGSAGTTREDARARLGRIRKYGSGGFVSTTSEDL
jgi:hypothetical protein